MLSITHRLKAFAKFRKVPLFILGSMAEHVSLLRSFEVALLTQAAMNHMGRAVFHLVVDIWSVIGRGQLLFILTTSCESIA